MFKFLSRKINYFKISNSQSLKKNDQDKVNKEAITADLKENLEKINYYFKSSDVVIHQFKFGDEREMSGVLIYIDSMVNKDVINKSILYPLMSIKNKAIDYSDLDTIKLSIITVTDITKVNLLSDIFEQVVVGYTILLIDGLNEALIINTKQFSTRNIEQPETENVVRGPREGFTESSKINISLLRRKIANPDLCFETIKIGYKTKTPVSIAYLKSIASPEILEEVKNRLNRIETDVILESGYIEEFIEDAHYSIFSTVGNSEKPDKVAAKLLEGRIAIIVEGTPFVLTVPKIFIESFQSEEDYYSRAFFSSIVRLIRFLAYFLSVFAPAIYVSLTVFHQELIPTELLITIVGGRKEVPFPAVVEAGIMLVTFDILREAGVRLPRPVGSAISIVGALVLGDAAVSAGFIGPTMVIVIAITAITGFVVPPQTDAVGILRYFYLILAGIAGGFGILMGMLIILFHMAALKSFGVPYLSPIAPLNISGLKDCFIRFPHWATSKRTNVIKLRNNDNERTGMDSESKKKMS